MSIDCNNQALLCLLQLASPALPVGAYSYSEGLETLVENGTINSQLSLKHWLEQELCYGAIRLEAAVMLRAYHSARMGDAEVLRGWNHWLSATKETEELRQQSWQMGQSLMRLLQSMPPTDTPILSLESLAQVVGTPCNFAIAFGIAAADWNIDSLHSVLGYLHSWTTNLVTSGVKLIPLGQTSGQQLLLESQSHLIVAADEILALRDDDLMSCGWGLALSSMAHETQYSRLFRS
ncbi:MAG: urease accessory protein UreF [Chroococcidiopsidaceae cyanobacterium CP_BM_RX_35]|nr:urease accessory protein UreF [Chroococcidiopsidaceae cyanobacterium CP_BM_RX_35]